MGNEVLGFGKRGDCWTLVWKSSPELKTLKYTTEKGYQSEGKEWPYFCFKMMCVGWDRTQGCFTIEHPWDTFLYHSATSPAHFLFFWDRVLLGCWCWPQTWTLPVSASFPDAGITVICPPIIVTKNGGCNYRRLFLFCLTICCFFIHFTYCF